MLSATMLVLIRPGVCSFWELNLTRTNLMIIIKIMISWENCLSFVWFPYVKSSVMTYAVQNMIFSLSSDFDINFFSLFQN